MSIDLEPPPQARVVPNGEPIEGGAHLFAGTIDGARDYVAALSREQRNDIAIWTPGHVFTVAELEAEARGHEHDPRRPVDG